MGLKALAFLAGAPEPLERFMAVSGADAGGLRERASEPAFLCAVLEFLLTDEGLLLTFCETESLKPELVHRASHALGG
ncbi:MAG: DUF3572 domain-containing protein [Alphaproteobacteria bacterium]|nr:DUF3572 domain-containing protein [Alphaproteobacteria bacterium]